MRVIIDGKELEATPGQTILNLTRKEGIYIPPIVLSSQGRTGRRCRVCVVEVEGMRNLQTACTAIVKDGMKVFTNTERVLASRRMVVDLLLASGRHDCLSCEQNGKCELEDAAYSLGIEHSSYESTDGLELDESSEFVTVDHGKCIKCGRCVAGCNQTVVNEVLLMGFRGSDSKVICDDDLPMGKSTCVQCGECVQLCPTGAIVDKKAKGKGRPWMLDQVNTTCAYCGVGRQLKVPVNRIKNRIVACVKLPCFLNEFPRLKYSSAVPAGI